MRKGRDHGDTWDGAESPSGTATIGFDGEPLPAPDRGAPPPEHVLREADGRYRPASLDGAIKSGEDASVVGRGGLGVVLAVHDAFLGRQVALKELRGAQKGGTMPTTVAASRFLREARVTAQLEHPSIVPVYEIGRRDDGRLYYTMKLVRGRTLADALAACAGLRQRLAIVGHFADVCHAIAYAHSRGVMHRDLKPANVMVGAFGETVVLDWGLAKMRGEADLIADEVPHGLVPDQAHTVMGAVMGTPAYMSPEQAAGRVDLVDERSDTWSLGAVLFEVLTGERPYGDISANEVVRKLQEGPPRRVRDVCPDVQQDLAAIADKALSYERVDRYPTAKEMAHDVDAFRSGARVGAYEYSSFELLWRFVARHRTTVAVAALAVILLTGMAALSWQGLVRERDRAVQAEQEALAQRSEAMRNLGDALVDRSLAALNDDDLHAAEIFAAGALEIAEDPDARGVLLRLGGTWRPEIAREFPVDAGSDVLAWSGDGAIIATGTSDTLTLWDATTGASRWSRPAPRRTRGARFSVDGRRFVTMHEDGDVRVWDVETAAEIVLPPHQPNTGASAAEWLADGTLIVAYKAGPFGAGIVRWEVDRGERLVHVPDTVTRWGMRRSPDGMRLLVAANEWVDILDGATLQQQAVVGRSAYSADWMPDGNQVVAVDGGGGFLVYDTGQSPPTSIAEVRSVGGAGGVTASPDGRFALERRESGLYVLRETRSWGRVFRFHAIDLRGSAFSPDGRWLATRSADGPLQIWDLGDTSAGRRLQDAPRPLHLTAWSDDGQRVATWGGGVASLWELPSGKRLAEITVAPDAGVVGLPGGRFAVVSDGSLQIRDPNFAETARYAVPKGLHLLLAQDGHTLVGLDPRGAVVRVDTATGVWREVQFDPAAPWIYLNSREPGTHVLVAGNHGHGRVDLETGEVALIEHEDSVGTYNWSATARDEQVLFGREDGAVHFYDPATGKLLRRMEVLDNIVRRLQLSSDGKLLAVGGSDQAVRVLDVATERTLAVVRGHENRLQIVALSPTSRWLTSTSWDGEAILSDLDALDTAPADVLASARKRYRLVLDGADVVPAP